LADISSGVTSCSSSKVSYSLGYDGGLSILAAQRDHIRKIVDQLMTLCFIRKGKCVEITNRSWDIRRCRVSNEERQRNSRPTPGSSKLEEDVARCLDVWGDDTEYRLCALQFHAKPIGSSVADFEPIRMHGCASQVCGLNDKRHLKYVYERLNNRGIAVTVADEYPGITAPSSSLVFAKGAY
jgi:hypothetical protein